MENVTLKPVRGYREVDVDTGEGIQQRDESTLARLGKRSVLKRNFGFMSILGFSCTILITWEGSLITFLQAFQKAPTSGGQYHWCSMLAPPSHKIFGYITGWLTVAGWQATFASGCYLCGTLIQGLMVLTDHNYNPLPWQGTLLYWAVVVFCVFINVAARGLLPKFEGLILLLHVTGFFAIIIPLIYLSDHSKPSEVFTTFLNGGKWPTQGVSLLVGMLGNVFAFTGADAATHMSEEIHNAEVIVPRSILTSMALNGCLGFGMIIATLFCLGDIQNALETPTGYPFIEIFYQATGSIAGTAVMTSIITILTISATVGSLASSSRVLWAFSRDRGLPGWIILSKVSSSTPRSLYGIMPDS
ncbi:unnamed protein product [Penicillium glandicola]